MPLLGSIYRSMAIAIDLASKVKLRTLDLLHLAYVKLMKDDGVPLERFLTADSDFERARGVLEDEMNIELRVITV